ncbi:hypothetical protein LOK46_21195 [Methylobacterium sp. NMS14P]|uniref:hypothetical protein n=1 Tax=Methylobacterium sp. NMS14P TaxID=2894310 RepID=UPI002358C0C2|nr:hypothetical protein [Methylobacterium sp. NMS14P]WCS23661.1 hypothetical protein LOK46_21195 [Methylobacterium sp. NMS14P]
MKKVPGDDGAMVPTGAHGWISGFGGSGGSQRLPSIGEAAANRPAATPAMTGAGAADRRISTSGGENVASWMEFYRRPTDQGGMGYTEQARGRIAMMQGEARLNLSPAAKGDHDRSGMPHAFGTVQWIDAKGNQRLPQLRALSAEMGKDWTDRSVQQEMYRREMMGAFCWVCDRIRGAQTGEQSLWTGIIGYENPREHNLAYGIRKPSSTDCVGRASSRRRLARWACPAQMWAKSTAKAGQLGRRSDELSRRCRRTRAALMPLPSVPASWRTQDREQR